MHLLTTPVLCRLLVFKASPERTRLIGLVLTLLFTVVMVTHMVMDEFLLHATTFGLAVLLIIVNISRLITQQTPDPDVRKRLQNMTRFGCCRSVVTSSFNTLLMTMFLVSLFLGYFIWLIDDWACALLISMRHKAGLPVAFLLELHGWYSYTLP